MCGILFHSFPDIPAKKVELNHRGPDYFGSYINNGIEFAHYRLSILDTGNGSNQPILVNDGVLIFNGEIYNFLELGNKYNVPATCLVSDTLVLANLLDRFGIEIVNELKGMYSFIWQDSDYNIFVVRDRLGIKPLYYFFENNSFVFCSEIRPIQLRVKPEIKMAKVFEFLSHGVIHSDTVWNSIKEVPVNKILTFNLKENVLSFISREQKMCLLERKPSDIKLLDRRIENSVRVHLKSDVPVGLLMSGGIDSSLIAYYASKYNNDITAYTADFGSNSMSEELTIAKRFAKEIEIQHQSILVDYDDALMHLDRLLDKHGQPFADAADIALSIIYSKTESKHKVLLQGDGGDELFGGYRRHRLFSLMSQMPRFFQKIDSKNRGLSYAKAFSNRESIRHSQLLREDRAHSALDFVRLSEEIRYSAHYDAYLEAYQNNNFRDYTNLEKLYYVDIQLLLKNIFLKKVDISSMLHSKEVRVPLLYDDIIEYFQTHNVANNANISQNKRQLRKIAKNHLPDYILNQPKMGFGVPYYAWLKKLGKDQYKDHLNLVQELMDIDAVGLLNNFDNPRYQFVHWKFFVLARWLKRQF